MNKASNFRSKWDYSASKSGSDKILIAWKIAEYLRIKQIFTVKTSSYWGRVKWYAQITNLLLMLYVCSGLFYVLYII